MRDFVTEYEDRLHFLVRLRWGYAGAVLFISLLFAHVLNVGVNAPGLQILALLIAAYNLVFRGWLRNVAGSGSEDEEDLLQLQAGLQIAADIVALGVAMHLTGGIESPLVFALVLPLIFAGMLLPRSIGYIQVLVALAAYSAVVVLEAKGLLHHYHTGEWFAEGMYQSPLQVPYVAFVAVILIATMYLTDTVASQLREREQELQETTEELERQAAQCNAAYVELMRTQRRQLAYMRKVAHELKSPISAITMMLQAIEDSLAEQIPEKQAGMLHRATARGEGALELTEDLLRLSELRSSLSTEESAQVSISHLIENVLEEQEMTAGEQDIVLTADIDEGVPLIIGYESELRDMLENLVSNAIKYSPDGGSVRVTAKAEAGEVILSVADEGIGMSEEEAGRVFDEFYRTSKARTAGIDGTGLGLSIVKSVVEHHGGHIEVEAEEDVGTTFRIRLPIDPSGALEAEEETYRGGAAAANATNAAGSSPDGGG